VNLLGLGSVDIIPANGRGPIASVHVFNDLGLSGTLGFDESDVPPTEALRTGDVGVLLGRPMPAISASTSDFGHLIRRPIF
jgi:hypothetical protein